jgi:CRISPR-associated protein Cas5t
LLSLVGETDRRQHIGARVTVALISQPHLSVVLRTVWRVKSKPLGASGNTRPDFQQLLTGVELVIWLDSIDDTSKGQTLEERVRSVVWDREYGNISRFGGLSLGESTHLVDEVSPYIFKPDCIGKTFLLNATGQLTLPVWVDHIGSARSNFVTGELQTGLLVQPESHKIPRIEPNLKCD